ILVLVNPHSHSRKRNSSANFSSLTKCQHILKAVTLRDVSDVHEIKDDIKESMILVIRVTPLAQKNVDELTKAVEEIYAIAKSTGCDIVRLGEERIIVTPPHIKIWKAEHNLK
ncbi:MAG: cell division protein SepF, partial [Nitrosopumilaceae archaeon]